MQEQEENVLYVQMFGNFQMSYNGHPLTGERQRDTHFTSLMQILLHNISSGVSRDYLEDVLLGDRDVENRYQALQTIVYKAKKKLKKMGLPDDNYIILEKGVYYWTPRIPVCEDAAVFDGLYKKAAECTDEDQQLEVYLEACYKYKGEFLSIYTAVLWAGAEARRYRNQFSECAEGAAAILRKKEDWVRLEELGKYVSKIDPFSDWECLTMEALMKRGRYKEASKLYADTADFYLREQGINLSGKFVKMMEELGSRMRHSYEALDQIQKGLEEDSCAMDGGYVCSYPVFRGIYHMVTRMMERGGQSIYLMLCTLVDSKGNPMKEGERLEEMSVRLGEAIRTSVRHGDMINRYGSGQYLILLFNITREDCDIIEERISKKFVMGRQRIGVEYHVNSVICEA